MSRPTILLLAAIDVEMDAVRQRLKLAQEGQVLRGRMGGKELIAAITGVGARRAVAMFDRLVAEHQPALVINFGFAGALDPALRAGDIVQPTSVMTPGGETIELEYAPGPRLLTVDRVIDSVQRKRELFAQHHAAAADMESFALANAARMRSVQLILLRAISDDAHTALPGESLTWVTEQGRTDTAAALKYLARRPWQLNALRKLQKNAGIAGQSLAEAVARACANL